MENYPNPAQETTIKPRLRVILEFPHGDPTEAPAIYPVPDCAESDEAILREILKRWSSPS